MQALSPPPPTGETDPLRARDEHPHLKLLLLHLLQTQALLVLGESQIVLLLLEGLDVGGHGGLGKLITLYR